MLQVRVGIGATHSVILDRLHEVVLGVLPVLRGARGKRDHFAQIKLGARIVRPQVDRLFQIVPRHGKQVVVDGDDAVVALQGGHDQREFAAGTSQAASLQLRFHLGLQVAGEDGLNMRRARLHARFLGHEAEADARIASGGRLQTGI